MFDDLDDPNPPRPGMHTLAAVTRRARQLGRRRSAWIGASAALVALALGGAVFALTGDNGVDTDIVDIATSDSTDATDTTDSVATATSTTVAVPGTSVVPATTITPPTTAPPPLATETTTAVTETTVAETTTTTTPETTTTAVVTPRPIVAIDGSGDAVIVELDGSRTLLREGPDPDDPPPAEGDVDGIDSVAINDDRSIALVGSCCEPIPGTILRYQLPDTSAFGTAFGHAPAFSPDGTKVAMDILGAVAVSDSNLVQLAITADDFLDRAGDGIVWIDSDTFVVFSAGSDTASLQSVTIANDGSLQPDQGWTGGNDTQVISLAGIGDGVVYLNGLASATLTAFDSITFQQIPASNITLPGEALSAWAEDGQLRWVGVDRQLHVGDTTIPGEYIWVR